ncbi:MAG: putative polysaccharide biosynthesis protein [Acutalibacteraceae bacterium]|jgi:stage V sporulation protein B
MSRKVFVKNAAILTATSLILRTVGIFFRVYMAGRLGAEGMGLYQLVFSIYVLASTFASAGICTAVTRLCADELAAGSTAAVGRVVRRAAAISAGIGLLSAAAIYGGAGWIAGRWLDDPRAIPSLRILTVSLPFMGISSCLRGYFIARRRVATPSRAQLLEQAVRIGAIVLLMGRWLPRGLGWGCAAVLAGDAAAEIASCGYQAIAYRLDRRRLAAAGAPGGRITRRLMAIAVPITAGRYLNTALRTVENVLVPAMLTRYCLSREGALASFGALKGMAMPLLFFPASFLNALSTLLIPEISEASALRQTRRVERAVNHTLHLTLTAAILLGGLFTGFSGELGQVFYHSDEVGFLLRVLAPLMPVMYLESVVDGILKGLDQQTHSLIYGVADSALRIGLIAAVVPRYGMAGFLFIMVISNLFTCGLNLHRLLTVTGLRLQWGQWIVKPALATAAAGGIALAGVQLWPMGDLPTLAVGGAVTALVCAVLLALLGCIRKEDLRLRG